MPLSSSNQQSFSCLRPAAKSGYHASLYVPPILVCNSPPMPTILFFIKRILLIGQDRWLLEKRSWTPLLFADLFQSLIFAKDFCFDHWFEIRNIITFLPQLSLSYLLSEAEVTGFCASCIFCWNCCNAPRPPARIRCCIKLLTLNSWFYEIPREAIEGWVIWVAGRPEEAGGCSCAWNPEIVLFS